MTSGGARARSGPAKNPNSRTSERAGYTLTSLPNAAYEGKPPRFPLPSYRVYDFDVDGSVVKDDPGARSFHRRELELWRQLWKSPQAYAWSMPQYSYMIWDIALYCRSLIIAQDSTAKAADRTLLPRYADRIGLSAAGLAQLGWRIAPDELAQKRLERSILEENANAEGHTFERRLRAV